MAKAQTGRKAPDFTLKTGTGDSLRLSDLKGTRVVLYFYPKDDTPGCTKQACGFQDADKSLRRKGAVVIGVSPDSTASHKKFAKKYKLSFPLLSDPKRTIAKKYGVYKPRAMYGKKVMGIERSTFIIDEKGKVKKVFRKVQVDNHIDEVMKALAK